MKTPFEQGEAAGFDEAKYKSLLEELEISEIHYSLLERTLRIDSEFYKLENLNCLRAINGMNPLQLTCLVSVSDGNHLSISEYFTEQGVPYYRGGDIYNFYIEQAQNSLRIPESIYNLRNMERSHLKKGDILVSIVGAIIGNLSLVKTDSKATCSCKLAILRPQKIRPELLAIFFKSKYGQNQIQKFRRGTGQTGFILEDFEQLLIPAFSDNFSKRIVGMVDSSYTAVKSSKALYQQAETLLLDELGLLEDKSQPLTVEKLEKIEQGEPLESLLELDFPADQATVKQLIERWESINTIFSSIQASGDQKALVEFSKLHLEELNDLTEKIPQVQQHLKGLQNNLNLYRLAQAKKQKTNEKNFSQSFAQSGRLDAEYYQLKYEEIVNLIINQKHEFLRNLVRIKKSIEPGSSQYDDTGIPFLRVADFNKFGITSPQKHLSSQFIMNNMELIETLKPKAKTILFSKDGSVGNAFMLEKNENLITSGAILHLDVLDENIVLPQYLTLVLNSEVVKMQAERDSGGSIILHWKPSEIEKVLIPLADIETQAQISQKITESFHLKKQSEQLLETAKTAVELAIEKSEEEAMEWMESEFTKLNVIK